MKTTRMLLLFVALGALATGCEHSDPEPENLDTGPMGMELLKAGTGNAGLTTYTKPAPDLRRGVEHMIGERTVKTGAAIGKYRDPATGRVHALIYEGLNDDGLTHFTEGTIASDGILLRDREFFHNPEQGPLIIDNAIRIGVIKANRDEARLLIEVIGATLMR